MYPFLFRVGDFALQSYTFFLGLAFLVALFVTLKMNRRFSVLKLSSEQIIFHSLCSFLIGLFSARLLFWIIELEKWTADPSAFFKPWEGGVVFWGGLLGGLGYWLILFRIKDTPIPEALSLLSVGISFGHAVGRLGCFFNGCCFGAFCRLDFFCVTFHDTFSNAPTNVPLYPTQLFESFFLTTLGLVLWKLEKLSINIKYIGLVWAFELYLVLYSTFRIFNEELRGDFRRGFWVGLSTSQWISILVVLALIIARIRFRFTDQPRS